MSQTFLRGICHLDADCFYASVETIFQPIKRGKPFAVISHVGGIVLSASYEARKFKIKTGMPTWEATAHCPAITFEPVNFPRYIIYSKAMMDILRTFTPDVEEYSIDEAFFDLTSVQQYHGCSYEQIARNIQKKIKDELNLPVSIGVSMNKTLAKLCSDYNKPMGITIVAEEDRDEFLGKVQLDDVAGIGRHNHERLQGNRIATLHEFIRTPTSRIKKILGINGVRLQLELRGIPSLGLQMERKKPKSISRSRTFAKLTTSFDFLFAELIRHLEDVTMKLREHHLAAKRIGIFLRMQENYRTVGTVMTLENFTDDTIILVQQINTMLKELYCTKTSYRSTGVYLTELRDVYSVSADMFSKLKDEERHQLNAAIDDINKRFGKKTISIGAATLLHPKKEREEEDDVDVEISYVNRFMAF
jgi:DNA polymerase-4/DNA polymerase V